MDMLQVNAAIEGEKQRAQTARIEAALTELVTMVKELKEEVAFLKAAKAPIESTVTVELQKAKRLGAQTSKE